MSPTSCQTAPPRDGGLSLYPNAHFGVNETCRVSKTPPPLLRRTPKFRLASRSLSRNTLCSWEMHMTHVSTHVRNAFLIVASCCAFAAIAADIGQIKISRGSVTVGRAAQSLPGVVG